VRCDICKGRGFKGSGSVRTEAEEQELRKQREKQGKALEEQELRNRDVNGKWQKLLEERELQRQKIVAQWQSEQQQRIRAKPASLQSKVRPGIVLGKDEFIKHCQTTDLLEKIKDDLQPIFSQVTLISKDNPHCKDVSPIIVCHFNRALLEASQSSVLFVFDMSDHAADNWGVESKVLPAFWRFREDMVMSVVNRQLNAVGWEIGRYAGDAKPKYPSGYLVSYALDRMS
jgi:hypothetical protein